MNGIDIFFLFWLLGCFRFINSSLIRTLHHSIVRGIPPGSHLSSSYHKSFPPNSLIFCSFVALHLEIRSACENRIGHNLNTKINRLLLLQFTVSNTYIGHNDWHRQIHHYSGITRTRTDFVRDLLQKINLVSNPRTAMNLNRTVLSPFIVELKRRTNIIHLHSWQNGIQTSCNNFRDKIEAYVANWRHKYPYVLCVWNVDAMPLRVP